MNPPFAPCGAWVSRIRSCYKTTMRFYPDNPGLLTDVAWFFTDPDAPYVGVPNSFDSRNWYGGVPYWPAIGEVEGATRQWSNGFTLYPADDIPVVGDKEWWIDGVDSSQQTPTPPCGPPIQRCGPPRLLSKVFTVFWEDLTHGITGNNFAEYASPDFPPSGEWRGRAPWSFGAHHAALEYGVLCRFPFPGWLMIFNGGAFSAASVAFGPPFVAVFNAVRVLDGLLTTLRFTFTES
jgi:hypothetical protein